MDNELGIYTVLLNGKEIKLQYNTYTLRLISKLFSKDLTETFNTLSNISQSIESSIYFIIAGAKSFDDAINLTEKDACNIIDELGGITNTKFVEFLNFAISQYVNVGKDEVKKKEKK